MIHLNTSITILHVAPLVPLYPNIGGLETLIRLISREIVNLGYKVGVLGSSKLPEQRGCTFMTDGFLCFVAHHRYGPAHHSFPSSLYGKIRHSFIVFINAIVMLPELLHIISKFKVKVVVFYGFYYAPFALLVRALGKRGYLGQFTFQLQWSKAVHRLDRFNLMKVFWFTILHCFSGIITTTKTLWTRDGQVINNFEMIRHIVGRDNVQLIPGGIDPTEFEFIEPDQTLLSLKNQGYSIVICPRRLVKEKGVGYLMEAVPCVLKNRSDTIFVFTGDGPMKNKLTRRAVDLKVDGNILFTGNVPKRKYLSLLKTADIVVIPSSEEENFGMAILEAYCLGKPIVATRIGGIPTVVKEGETGILVQPADPIELAEAIVMVLGSSELRQHFSVKARKVVSRKFEITKVADSLLKAYGLC